MTATPGPESAAHNITAMKGRIRGIAAAMAAGETVHPDALDLALDALVAAVRHHDAEVVRADTGHIRYGSAEEYAIRHAALIDPASPMNRVGAKAAQ